MDATYAGLRDEPGIRNSTVDKPSTAFKLRN